MNIPAHQEKTANEQTGSKRKEKIENNPPILERPRAALLRSFREQRGEKVDCMRGVFGTTGTFEKANSNFDPNKVGNRTTTLRRLLIGADFY